MLGVRRHRKSCTAWMDNIKTWTGLTMEKSAEWQRTKINRESTFMVWTTLRSKMAEEQNRTEQNTTVTEI